MTAAPRVQHGSRSAEALLERVFGAQIAPEHPLVFQHGFGGALVTLEIEGEVRSACAILRRDLIVGSRTIPCGLIGSVATDATWRGLGLARRVLEAAEQELCARGASIALLWADDPGFYERLGYRPFGAEVDVILPTRLAASLPTSTGVRSFQRGDERAIHALYREHDARVDRSLAETTALLGVPRMRVLVRERAGRVVAYACLGRGRDLTGVIHEWGGAAHDVLVLVRAHLEERLAQGDESPLFLMAPSSRTNLVPCLEKIGAPVALGVLALAKPLEPEVLERAAQVSTFLWGLDSL